MSEKFIEGGVFPLNAHLTVRLLDNDEGEDFELMGFVGCYLPDPENPPAFPAKRSPMDPTQWITWFTLSGDMRYTQEYSTSMLHDQLRLAATVYFETHYQLKVGFVHLHGDNSVAAYHKAVAELGALHLRPHEDPINLEFMARCAQFIRSEREICDSTLENIRAQRRYEMIKQIEAVMFSSTREYTTKA